MSDLASKFCPLCSKAQPPPKVLDNTGELSGHLENIEQKVAKMIDSQKYTETQIRDLREDLYLDELRNTAYFKKLDAENQKIIKPGDFSGDYIHYGVREHGMLSLIHI